MPDKFVAQQWTFFGFDMAIGEHKFFIEMLTLLCMEITFWGCFSNQKTSEKLQNKHHDAAV